MSAAWFDTVAKARRDADAAMAAAERTPEERAKREAAAWDAAFAALDRQAQKTAAFLIKQRARRYVERPTQLEILYPGLSTASPIKMIAIGEHLLEFERAKRPFFGFGGEVMAINAKAVVLLGRAMRRAERKMQEAA
jgi:hypothetical protein